LVTAGLSRFGATTWATTDQEYVTKALYQYRVGGVSYEGQRISPWVIVASHNARVVLEKQMASIQRLSGDKVKVFYNPKRPQKSYLVIAGWFGIVCIVLIAVLPLVYYYFRFYQ
jgi:hypothetical protein